MVDSSTTMWAMTNLTTTPRSTVTPMPCPEVEAQIPLLTLQFLHQPLRETVIMLLYAFVITIGCCGNALTIFVSLRKPAMRSNRNLFIVNLALADFFLCSVTAPITMYTNIHRLWLYGEHLCKAINGIQGFNVFLSTLSISAIGFIAVMAPTTFDEKQKRLLIIGILLGVWLMSAILSAPLFYVSGIKALFPALNLMQRCNFDIYACQEVHSHWQALPISSRSYTYAALAFQYVIPLVTLTFVYSQISGRIRRRLRPRPNTNANNLSTTLNDQDSGGGPPVKKTSTAPGRRRSTVSSTRSRRTHYLLVMIVSIFACSWLPFNVYTILYTQHPEYFHVFPFALTHILGMTSACSNPILYAVLNENFRKEFIEVWTLMRLNICPFLWDNRFWACSQCICSTPAVTLMEQQATNRKNTAEPKASRCRFFSIPSATQMRVTNGVAISPSKKTSLASAKNNRFKNYKCHIPLLKRHARFSEQVQEHNCPPQDRSPCASPPTTALHDVSTTRDRDEVAKSPRSSTSGDGGAIDLVVTEEPELSNLVDGDDGSSIML